MLIVGYSRTCWLADCSISNTRLPFGVLNLIIKIDKEGAEFDILRFSKLIYEKNILALIIEVSNSKIKRFIRQSALNNFSLVRLNINQKIFRYIRYMSF